MARIVSKSEQPWRSKRVYNQLAHGRALSRLRDRHRRQFELLLGEEIDKMEDQPEKDET